MTTAMTLPSAPSIACAVACTEKVPPVIVTAGAVAYAAPAVVMGTLVT
jgi:hypothetical protein